MATIASLVVNLSAKIADFVGPVEKAKSTMGGFTSILGKIGAPLTIGAAATAFKAFVDRSEETITSQTKLADKLGLTTQRVAGLQFGLKSMGLEIENFGTAFKRIQQVIGESGIEGSEAQNHFKKIGFDPKQLKLGDFQGSLGKIADYINRLPDASQRTAAWIEIAGEEGLKLVPIFSQGSKGMAEMEARAARFGLTFSRAQGLEVAAGVRAWKQAKADIGASIDGIGNRIAHATAGTKMASWVSRQAEDFSRGVGDLAERIAFLFSDEKHIADYRKKRAEALKGIAAGEAKKQKEEEDLFAAAALGKEITTLNEKLQQEAQAFGQVAHYAEIAALAKKGATQRQLAPLYQLAENTEAQKTFKELNDRIAQQYATISKMPYAIDAWKAAEKGLSAAHVEQVAALSKQSYFLDQAYQLYESTRTPLEQFAEKQAELQRILDSGAASWDLYARGVGKAAQELLQAAGVTAEVHAPGAALAGSKEEYSIFARLANNGNNSPQEKLRQAIEQLRRTEEIQRQLQEEMVRLLRQPNYVVVSGK